MMYSVRITRKDGTIGYMSHRDKTAWPKATALRFARQYASVFGGIVAVVIAEQLSNGQWY